MCAVESSTHRPKVDYMSARRTFLDMFIRGSTYYDAYEFPLSFPCYGSITFYIQRGNCVLFWFCFFCIFNHDTRVAATLRIGVETGHPFQEMICFVEEASALYPRFQIRMMGEICMEESRDNLARVQAFENFVLLLLYFVCYWDCLSTIGTGREASEAMHLLVQKPFFTLLYSTH